MLSEKTRPRSIFPFSAPLGLGVSVGLSSGEGGWGGGSLQASRTWNEASLRKLLSFLSGSKTLLNSLGFALEQKYHLLSQPYPTALLKNAPLLYLDSLQHLLTCHRLMAAPTAPHHPPLPPPHPYTGVLISNNLKMWLSLKTELERGDLG